MNAPAAPSQRLTTVQWLVCGVAALGFAFDTYELLMMPIVARPALERLLHVNQYTASGNQAILAWTSYITYSSAVCGGVFGLLGGYLTDRFGRKKVLFWSVMLYALSPFAAAFSTSALMLLVLRCTTFIGVCVEFVAAVAWIAELFPEPRRREAALGYTQAFASVGGLMVSGMYVLLLKLAKLGWLPAIYGMHAPADIAWRYTLMSGLIPALPLILLLPFLPESPAWLEKKAKGTLRRPSLAAIFQPAYRRTTIVSTLIFACSLGAAFGAIQLAPQIVPGLVRSNTEGIKAMQATLDKMPSDGADEKVAQERKDLAKEIQIQENLGKLKILREQLEKLAKTEPESDKFKETQALVAAVQVRLQSTIGGVQFVQEIGGLFGRCALAILAMWIVSRRWLLRIFQIPGLIVVPLVFAVAAGTMKDLELFKWGMFAAGFFTVAQLSFWGNYLPRVYPTHLRGTGEGFAANVGGRMIGTVAQVATVQMTALLANIQDLSAPPQIFTRIAFAAAIVGFSVYLIGTIACFWLPEPQTEALPE